MKKTQMLTAAAVIWGIVGFAVRRLYLITALEPGTGLPISGVPARYGLAIVVILTMVTSAVLSGGYRKWNPESDNFETVFAIPGTTTLTAVLASGALMIFSGLSNVAAFIMNRSVGMQGIGIIRPILGFLCIIAGIGIIFTAASLKHEKEAKSPALVAPGFVMCIWAMASYRNWAQNPVLGRYIIPLLAVLIGMIACYMLAGFAYGKPNVRITIVLCFLGASLAIMALGDMNGFYDILLFASQAVFLLTMMLILSWNCSRETK